MIFENAEQLDAFSRADQRHDSVGGDQRVVGAQLQHGIAVFFVAVDDAFYLTVYFEKFFVISHNNPLRENDNIGNSTVEFFVELSYNTHICILILKSHILYSKIQYIIYFVKLLPLR